MNSTQNSMLIGGVQNKEWTYEENRLFEKALAEMNIDSPTFFDNVMAILPSKTIDEIKSRYEQLINDFLIIEVSNFSASSPVYHNNSNNTNVGVAENKRKAVPWTEEEHRSFLLGLQNCGKGDWKNISKYYVPTKTTSQVASHAQKYFRRIKCKTPLEKRRHSIHDIRIVNNSTIAYTAARNPNYYVNYPTNDLINHPPHAINPPNHNLNHSTHNNELLNQEQPLTNDYYNNNNNRDYGFHNSGYQFDAGIEQYSVPTMGTFSSGVTSNASLENATSNVGRSNNNNVEIVSCGENNVLSNNNDLYDYERFLSTPCDGFP